MTAPTTPATLDIPSERKPVPDLLVAPIRIINVGLESFADELRAQAVPVTHVDWAPPAGGDPKLADLLAKLGT